MTESRSPARLTAAALRKDFDDSFALAPAPPRGAGEDLLGFRIGEDRWAFRLRDLAGIAPLRELVPLPSRLPELMGLAGIGGVAVPVYDLALLLGAPADSGHAAWLARYSAGGDDVALAFGRLDGHLRLEAEKLFPPRAGRGERSHVALIARAGEEMRAVVDLASLVSLIRQRVVGGGATRREP